MAALLRNVGDVGFGAQEQTYLCLVSFARAHAATLREVGRRWRGMADFYDRDALQRVADELEAESRAELDAMQALLETMDAGVRRTMRTVIVSSRVLSMQRNAVLDLAKRGLVPDSEREVLLRQVLEDSREVNVHAADRKRDVHRARAPGAKDRRSPSGIDDDYVNWVTTSHRCADPRESDVLRAAHD